MRDVRVDNVKTTQYFMKSVPEGRALPEPKDWLCNMKFIVEFHVSFRLPKTNNVTTSLRFDMANRHEVGEDT